MYSCYCWVAFAQFSSENTLGKYIHSNTQSIGVAYQNWKKNILKSENGTLLTLGQNSKKKEGEREGGMEGGREGVEEERNPLFWHVQNMPYRFAIGHFLLYWQPKSTVFHFQVSACAVFSYFTPTVW